MKTIIRVQARQAAEIIVIRHVTTNVQERKRR